MRLRIFAISIALAAILTPVITGIGVLPAHAATVFASPAFGNTWQKGEAMSPGYWGPLANARDGLQEPYKEAEAGQRLVQYFDKGRMEMPTPAAGAVTSGLLAVELITGRVQLGDNTFQQGTPAAIPVGGDTDSGGPTYASIKDNAAQLLAATSSTPGVTTTQSLSASGTLGTLTGNIHDAQATITGFDATQHNIPVAFANYRNRVGFLTVGLAISEPFWSSVKISGKQRDVLIQVFERRVMTYTPSNPEGFRVEFGNTGQHYYAWRYKSAMPLTVVQTMPQPMTSGYQRGVALAGADFAEDNLPGKYEVDYVYPTAAELDYFQGKGLALIRLPFRWERLQPSAYGPLNNAELGRIDAFIAAARVRNMHVILDAHNYARYYGAVIGTTAVPNAAFTDFWRKLADHFKSEPAIWAYGLMNEPHDTGGRWPTAAQAGMDGIRAADRVHTVLVSGDGWSGAWSWAQNNETFSVNDPANNIMYEAHQYFDADSSGAYAHSYDAEGAYPTVGADRVKPFVNWLKQHRARGFIGEYGVPDSDARWLTVLDNFLSYLDANGVGGTYWAGGQRWGNYPLSVEPNGRKDRPQMAVLVKHLSR